MSGDEQSTLLVVTTARSIKDALVTVGIVAVGKTVELVAVCEEVLDERALVVQRKLLSHCIHLQRPPVVNDDLVSLPVVLHGKGGHKPTIPVGK